MSKSFWRHDSILELPVTILDSKGVEDQGAFVELWKGYCHSQYDRCLYCNSTTSVYTISNSFSEDDYEFWTLKSNDKKLTLCKNCGWWSVGHQITSAAGPPKFETNKYHLIRGALKIFDYYVPEVTLDEINKFLSVNATDRYLLNPYRLEQLVSAVFSNIGFHSLITSKSNDGGVDIFLFHDSSDHVIGVQVKRWQIPIGAEEIRSFTGALFLSDITEGIFITTSRYTSGAYKTAEEAKKHGTLLKLNNCDDLLKELGIGKDFIYEDINCNETPFAKYWLKSDLPPEVGSSEISPSNFP